MIWTTFLTTCVFFNTSWSDFRESTRVALDAPSSLLGAARQVGVGAFECAYVVMVYLLDWLMARPERDIAVVSHWVFLLHLFPIVCNDWSKS